MSENAQTAEPVVPNEPNPEQEQSNQNPEQPKADELVVVCPELGILVYRPTPEALESLKKAKVNQAELTELAHCFLHLVIEMNLLPEEMQEEAFLTLSANVRAVLGKVREVIQMEQFFNALGLTFKKSEADNEDQATGATEEGEGLPEDRTEEAVLNEVEEAELDSGS